jgi:hypothetical protein
MKRLKNRQLKKSLLYVMISALLLTYSCKDKDDDEIKTFNVKIQLIYPADYQATAGINVKLENTLTQASFDAQTNDGGIAEFIVTAGTYEASVTEKRVSGLNTVLLNGIKSNLIISDAWTGNEITQLPLSESKTNQLVIKELYIGGCQRNDGSGSFAYDKYVILYNNSDEVATLENVCLGMVNPYNSQASNADIIDGKLFYEAEGWIPAGTGIWTFRQTVTLNPGKQIVIALTNALDNTVTYSNSINFSNPDYYCTYDIEQYPNTTYYPSPVQTIPTSHYLKAYHYGTGNAWPLSVTSPAFFIFKTEDVSPADFAADADRTNLYNNSTTQVRKKVPVEWVVDGIEVYAQGNAANKKRLTAAVDAGYVEHTNTRGYSLYRNVDKEATEAIEGNTGKLVYNYALGTAGVIENGTTDPSGIDAEASIKAGARIIYKDTNNASNDFHQRSRASLKN